MYNSWSYKMWEKECHVEVSELTLIIVSAGTTKDIVVFDDE